MQGPTYIETNPTLKRYREYSQKLHEKKLSEIRQKSLKRLENKPGRSLKPKGMSSFKHVEQAKAIRKENQLLLEKLVGISQGRKSAAKTQLQIPKPKSLNICNRKREAERIASENEALAKRLLHRSPQISKKRLDMDYEAARKYRNQIKKLRTSSVGRKKLPPLESDRTGMQKSTDSNRKTDRAQSYRKRVKSPTDSRIKSRTLKNTEGSRGNSHHHSIGDLGGVKELSAYRKTQKAKKRTFPKKQEPLTIDKVQKEMGKQENQHNIASDKESNTSQRVVQSDKGMVKTQSADTFYNDDFEEMQEDTQEVGEQEGEMHFQFQQDDLSNGSIQSNSRDRSSQKAKHKNESNEDYIYESVQQDEEMEYKPQQDELSSDSEKSSNGDIKVEQEDLNHEYSQEEYSEDQISIKSSDKESAEEVKISEDHLTTEHLDQSSSSSSHTKDKSRTKPEIDESIQSLSPPKDGNENFYQSFDNSKQKSESSVDQSGYPEVDHSSNKYSETFNSISYERTMSKPKLEPLDLEIEDKNVIIEEEHARDIQFEPIRKIPHEPPVNRKSSVSSSSKQSMSSSRSSKKFSRSSSKKETPQNIQPSHHSHSEEPKHEEYQSQSVHSSSSSKSNSQHNHSSSSSSPSNS